MQVLSAERVNDSPCHTLYLYTVSTRPNTGEVEWCDTGVGSSRLTRVE